MHDTAFGLGILAMDIYADQTSAKILAVGPRDLNVALRAKISSPGNYVAIDIKEDVDAREQLLPEIDKLAEGAFDLIVATSVFEHDPSFWNTFVEFCRKAKEGGYIYINSASSGSFRPVPQDYWRFYPDSGTALAKWATAQGQTVSLVESLVADRAGGALNDFAAVFHKGRITKKLPDTFLYEHFPCWNVRSWKHSEPLNPRAQTEEMVLLEDALGRMLVLEQSLTTARASCDSAAGTAARLMAERETVALDLQTMTAEAKDLRRSRDEIARNEAELKERHEQERSRAEEAKKQLYVEAKRRSEAEAKASNFKNKYDRQSVQIAELRDALDEVRAEQKGLIADGLAQERLTFRKQLHDATEKLAAAERANRETRAEAQAALVQAEARFEEIVILTGLLREQEAENHAMLCHAEWHRAVHQSLESQPKWWMLMPNDWRKVRERRRLKRDNLFDAVSYLQRYPDIAAAGLDPLYHYMTHGHFEGRSK